ncbi:MAG: hypothetical protein QW412_03380 [Candidatus Aenigmatarchaeota archaeon]
MSLYEDAKRIILDLFGPKFLNVLDSFEDPKKYPMEFLEELKYFLEKAIGKEAAEEYVKPLYEKYGKTRKIKKIAKESTSSSKGLSLFFCGGKIPLLIECSSNPTTNLLNYCLHKFL